MSEFPFQKFIKLVAFDQNLRSLEQQLTVLMSHYNEGKAEIARLAQELEVAKRHKDAMQREVDRQEKEMAELSAKQAEKERLLDKTTNVRESQALYNEIALIKQAQFDFEENLLLSWAKFENANRDYQNQKKILDEKISNLEEKVAENKKQQDTVENTLDEQQQHRLEYEEGIPAEWLEKYALMRRTVANPVVPVKNDSCSACFYQIVPQDLVRLRNNALLQCKSCYRFLYMETP